MRHSAFKFCKILCHFDSGRQSPEIASADTNELLYRQKDAHHEKPTYAFYFSLPSCSIYMHIQHIISISFSRYRFIAALFHFEVFVISINARPSFLRSRRYFSRPPAFLIGFIAGRIGLV